MKLMNNLGTILTFGDRILAAGYFYDPNGRSYYGAVYLSLIHIFQRVRRGHAPGRCDGAAAVRSERKLI